MLLLAPGYRPPENPRYVPAPISVNATLDGVFPGVGVGVGPVAFWFVALPPQPAARMRLHDIRSFNINTTILIRNNPTRGHSSRARRNLRALSLVTVFLVPGLN